MSMIDRLKKRRCYPVQIGEDTVYLRSMTLGEMDRTEKLPYDDRTGFVLACSLIQQDGTPEFSAITGETDAELSGRVIAAMSDVPDDNLRAIADAIQKLRHTPTVESIAKN